MKKSQADIMKIVNKKTAEALRVRANILDPDGNPANLELEAALDGNDRAAELEGKCTTKS